MNRQLQTLRHLISQHFDKSELNDLFFDLELDSEEAGSERKSDLVRYLIEACIYRGQLPDLLNLCQQHRPHLTWPVILEQDLAIETPFLQKVPLFSTIWRKVAVGAARGVATGVIMGLLAVVGWVLFYRMMNMFLFSLALGAGSIGGTLLGMLIGLIEADEENDWWLAVAFGGLEGLIVGLVVGLIADWLLGSENFVLTLLVSLGLGLGTGAIFWATQAFTTSSLPFMLARTTPYAEQALTSKLFHRYAVIGRFLAGAIIGALAGALAGLIYDSTFAQDDFFGIVTTSISIPPSISGTLTLMGAGLLSGAIFLAVHRALARQLNHPTPGKMNVRWSGLVILAAVSLTVIVAGLRPLGHFFRVQSSANPFTTHEYIGRVIPPISGAKVTLLLEGVPIETSTDSDGVYRFALSAAVESLTGKIYVASRLYRYEGNITIRSESTTLADIRLLPAGDRIENP